MQDVNYEKFNEVSFQSAKPSDKKSTSATVKVDIEEAYFYRSEYTWQAFSSKLIVHDVLHFFRQRENCTSVTYIYGKIY